MHRKWLLTLTTTLIVAAASQTTPAQGPPPKAASPAASREAIETFRKLMLRQLSSTTPWMATSQDSNLLPLTGSDPLALNTLNAFQSSANQLPNKAVDPRVPANTFFRNVDLAQRYHPTHSTFLNSTTGAASIEGTYLPGHGVLFLGTVRHLTLPTSSLAQRWAKSRFCATCHVTPTEPEKEDKPSKTQQADDEWEAIKSGGVKQPSKDPTTAKPGANAPQHCVPSLLAERMIQLLADHGHRFSDVGPHERITLQLHIRGSDQVLSNSPLLTPDGNQVLVFQYPNYVVGDLPIYTPDYAAASRYVKRNVGTAGETAGNQPNPVQEMLGGDETVRTFVRQQNALAELHLKEGNLGKALEAYRKLTDTQYTLDPAVRAEAYRNAAVVLIKQGKVAEAQGLLGSTLYSELLKGQAQKTASTKPSQPAAKAAVPQHWTLTVSATKAQCDSVRAGKTSLEDFAKAIEVKTSN
jgi:hypothetical protein